MNLKNRLFNRLWVQGYFVEHDRRKCQWGSVFVGEYSHGVIAVAAERCLEEWHVKFETAECEHGVVYIAKRAKKPANINILSAGSG